MIIDDVRFKLKAGREAVLRSPKEEDIESALEYLVVSAGKTDFILRCPEECGKYTPEGEKKFFEHKKFMAIPIGDLRPHCKKKEIAIYRRKWDIIKREKQKI